MQERGGPHSTESTTLDRYVRGSYASMTLARTRVVPVIRPMNKYPKSQAICADALRLVSESKL
jgi:hypothetical protein